MTACVCVCVCYTMASASSSWSDTDTHTHTHNTHKYIQTNTHTCAYPSLQRSDGVRLVLLVLGQRRQLQQVTQADAEGVEEVVPACVYVCV